jgi:putative heme iron utilization protein
MNYYNQHLEMFKLLTHEGDGVLSTISLDVPGYPFGSVTPYCLDRNFIPNILISSIAQHTKNIKADPKVSLLISETGTQTNKQALSRLTYIGEAQRVEDDGDIKKRYISYFPAAATYFKTHDFAFYRINPVRLRFIGGFGKIYWIEKADLSLQNIFPVDDELKIVEHMNQDHRHNLKDYVRFYLGLESMEGDALRMTGLDQFGFDLSLNEVKHRIDFKAPLESPAQTRSVFVEMAKASAALK